MGLTVSVFVLTVFRMHKGFQRVQSGQLRFLDSWRLKCSVARVLTKHKRNLQLSKNSAQE
jgi:hypothetical protein